MEPRLPPDDRSFALANLRGGALPDCEAALTAAGHALALRADPGRELTRVVAVLRQAGWAPALRFAETLVFTAGHAAEGGAPRAIFEAALRAFTAAIKRRNLNEIACSPTLFEHYRHLSVLMAGRDRAVRASLDDIALAARPVPAASLHPVGRPDAWFHLRARYERALLPILRAHADDAPALLAQVETCLDELDECVGELIGPDPYDMWRLAAGALQSLRMLQDAGDIAQAHAKRVIARLNLLLAEHARGGAYAPQELVRATLAAAWQPYALGYGATVGAQASQAASDGAGGPDADQVPQDPAASQRVAAQAELLRDYGLSAAWPVTDDSDTAALWEAPQSPESSRAVPTESLSVPRSDFSRAASGESSPATPADSSQAMPAGASARTLPAADSSRASRTGFPRSPSADFAGAGRRIGPLLMDANAFEDFLQVADASMAELNVEARAAFSASNGRADPFAAFRAAQAAYRLGALAWALGLGGLASLADAIGLGWRRVAHGASGASPQATVPPRALDAAGETLRRLLHQIAAGIPPSDSAAALLDLASAIEGSRRVGGL